MPGALTHVFAAVRAWEQHRPTGPHARRALEALDHADAVLAVYDGVVRSGSVPLARLAEAEPAEVDSLLAALDPAEPATIEPVLAARHRARSERAWADADRLRDALRAAGITVRDTEEGARWSTAGRGG